MGYSVFVIVRVLHLLLAALWLGAGVFIAAFLLPTLRRVEAGDLVLAELLRSRMDKFMASVAGLTVLTGLWLYWLYTGGLRIGIPNTATLMYVLGGLIGLVAAIIGGAVIGRGVKRIAVLAEQAASMDGNAERAAHMQELAAVRHRTTRAAQWDAVLLIVVLLLMGLAHYV